MNEWDLISNNGLSWKSILIIGGGLCLAAGLYLDFKCIYIRDKLAGRGKFGLSVGTAIEQKDLEKRYIDFDTSKRFFIWGIILTALGILLNVIGSLL